MKNRCVILVLSLCMISPTFAMWKQVSGQKVKGTCRKVHFESTATILCDKPKDEEFANKVLLSYLLPYNSNHRSIISDSSCAKNNCDGSCHKTPNHLLIGAGQRPYTFGNGGLLNPTLLKYDVIAEQIEGGARVTVRGVVETEGIAPLALNATEYGQCHNDDPNIEYCYETSWLEDAILGALKERSVDRGLSDLTDTYFSGGEFLQEYNKALITEWTSHLNDEDDGKRSPEHAAMIKRHFPRKGYWPSRWHNSQRSGRYESELLTYWNREKDGATFKVTLDSFKIDVE